jgi:hypothetical protein
MRRAAVLGLVGVAFLAACGGDGDDAGTTTATGGRVVIRTSMAIAAMAGAEPIAIGKILDGSTLRGSPFCAGGTIRDTHAGNVPAVKPYGAIARTITCPEGTVTIGFTPTPETGTGTWTIVSGTGAYDALRGSGKMVTAYDPKDPALGRETLTGTVTRQ